MRTSRTPGAGDGPAGREGPVRRRALAVLLVLVGIAALATTARSLPVGAWGRTFFSWVEGLGGWAVAAYVAAYVLATVLLVPTWMFSIAGGVLFGLGIGIPVVLVAAGGGATLAFILGRTLLRRTVARWIDRHPRLQAVDVEIERRGWILAALLRLSPLVPYNVLNYALGATSLPLGGYVLSLLAMLPVLTLYVAIGSALEGVAAAEDRARGGAEWALLAVGIAATLVVSAWLGRVAARAATFPHGAASRRSTASSRRR